MGLFVCKSEKETKIIMVLIFWGIEWLYRYLTASDDSIANEDEDEDKVKDKPPLPITAIPITSKVESKAPPPAPCSQVIAANPPPSPSASSVIEKRKASLGNKRKLFRNILLVDALMQRKDFIA